MIPTARILVGDCRERLRELPDNSAHCVMTSPPYWGLRKYDPDTHEAGMIGLEETFEEYLENLVGVFREVRRVLRLDGTLWLNVGDAYAGSGATGTRDGYLQGGARAEPKQRTPLVADAKPKDLLMMPAQIALALRADGWWLRSEIVWRKPNPMPESVKDRPTSAHEKVFLLAENRRYFYDHAAVRTKPKIPDDDRKSRVKPEHKHSGDESDSRRAVMNPHKTDKQRGHSRRHAGFNDRWDAMTRAEQQARGANLRNVWSIATRPYRGAHFAVFPPDLAKPCILAGTSAHGVCSECGAPWKRHKGATLGWEPTCKCDAEVVPATILDPFGGAGTVGLVALSHGRSAVLMEISDAYAQMSADRITAELADKNGVPSMFVNVEIERSDGTR